MGRFLKSADSNEWGAARRAQSASVYQSFNGVSVTFARNKTIAAPLMQTYNEPFPTRNENSLIIYSTCSPQLPQFQHFDIESRF